MKIYMDSDYRCLASPASGRIQVETDFFDGKCDAYIGCPGNAPGAYSEFPVKLR